MDRIAAARAELWEAKRFLEKLPPNMKRLVGPAVEHLERASALLSEPAGDGPGKRRFGDVGPTRNGQMEEKGLIDDD